MLARKYEHMTRMDRRHGDVIGEYVIWAANLFRDMRQALGRVIEEDRFQKTGRVPAIKDVIKQNRSWENGARNIGINMKMPKRTNTDSEKGKWDVQPQTTGTKYRGPAGATQQ